MDHESIVVTTVVAFIGLLFVAAIAAVGLRRARLPYSVGLVLLGLGFGALAERFEPLAVVTQIELSPEIILFIFLPTLIFESAFNLDSRLLFKNLAPVVALAAPGLLVSTAIIGGLVTLATPLSPGPALLFGALISATDPVAVVALFKELGAPKRLAILVEGESLFNDATAIVLFQIISAVLVGGALGGAALAGTVGTGVVDFFVVFVGGLAVGGVVGYAMVRSIALAADDPLVEVSLSTVVAYAAFILADHYLGVSGVMATVGAGAVVGAFGTPRFTPPVRAFLREFWEYAAFVANGLIFLLVGLSVQVGALAESIVPIGLTIGICLFARGVVTFGLLPLVGRLPGVEPVDRPNQAVLWWGGLRGAVALALALSIPEGFAGRDLIIVLSVGVVLFTILSGGLSMGRLIAWLKLDRPSLAQQIARAQATAAAKREALVRVDRMATSGTFSERLIADLRTEYEREADNARAALTSLRADCRSDDIEVALWLEACTIEQATYRDLLDHGVISEPVLRELELAVDQQRDLLAGGKLPNTVPEVIPLEVRVASRFLRLVERVRPKGRVTHRHRLRELASKYERDVAGVEASRRIADGLGRFADLSGDGDTVSAVIDVYEKRGAEAMQRMDAVAEHFPEYVNAVQARTARRIALDGEADAVEVLAAAGAIPESVAERVRRSVGEAHRRLTRRPIEALDLRPEELLVRVPFFRDLAAADFQQLKSRLVSKPVVAGETIVRQGERGNSLFLIGRGVVAVIMSANGSTRRVASLHAGDFFGEMALLTDQPRVATVEAVTNCQLYELTKREVDDLCAVCSGVKQALLDALEARRQPDQAG